LDGVPPYRFPPLSILAAGQPGAAVDGSSELKMNAARLLETIKSFGIEARIVSVTRGPTVARYELELDRGIKLSRLTGLSDDIALSLGASGVRIAPVPGKMSVVGIEVPNKLVSLVYLRDVLTAPEFARQESRLAFAVGKDIGGSAIVCDLSKLTHLLIAGTTGSGKSVCMNSLIVSLLYKASPEEVRMVMIDPKMVELGVYNGIPHLEAPVVTDPKKAAGALHKVVMEMESRYQRFMERRVRDIFSYNQSVEADPDIPRMPQMVVIIDELADLMLVAAKEVEESICRVAQKARAAGIHLVIATQRPSADVITGLMKANIPSRIAFAVASQLESRIILDTMGAEKLVGRGDMLLYPLGAPKPSRVQGCLITSAEVEHVVEAVKRYGEARYSEEFMADIEKFAEGVGKKGGLSNISVSADSGSEADDDMLTAAIELALESGQASTSFLQRRLKLGFARAARLVDQMEERGIVGPSEGSKPRQLLISRQQWQELQMRREGLGS
jgi:S-DNA-T family DNA segregation ATPase FtsK/SpoIIIE